MIYNDNSCSQCGGIRVARSTLCADCLVACNVRVLGEKMSLEYEIELSERNFVLMQHAKDREIEELKYKYKILWKVTQKIFAEYQKYLRAYREDEEKIDAINRSFR